MENITTAEVLDKLDMFQSRFGKIDQFGWWYLERISADAGTQFTSTEFKEECQIRGVRLTLAALKHQEMNGKLKLHEEHCVQLHTLLGYMLEFQKFIYLFRSNVHDRSYLSGPTYKRSYKQGCISNNSIKIGNMYETFSVTFTCFILSVCCTEIYGAC